MGQGPRDSLTPGGWKGNGSGVSPPSSTAGPPGPTPSGCPLAATAGQHWGAGEEQRGAPPPFPLPPLPPPKPTDSQRPARGTAAPQPPSVPERIPPLRGPRHPGRNTTGPVRRTPPVSRPPTPAIPAAGQQPCAVAQGHRADRIRAAARGREPVQCGGRGKTREARLDARPGGAVRQTQAERPPAPRPPGPPG